MGLTMTVLGCQGPFPGPGGETTGYLLDDGQTKLLVDCGSGIARWIAAIGYDMLDAVVLSHWHADHASDLCVLGYARKRVLPVYAPLEPQQESARLALVPTLTPYWYQPSDRFTIGSLDVQVRQMQHPYPSYAIRVQAGNQVIGFTGDTRLVPSLSEMMKNVNIMVAHTPFLHAQLTEQTPQLSCLQAAQVAREAGAGMLVLAHHLPTASRCAYEQEAKTEFKHTLLAHQGMTLACSQVK